MAGLPANFISCRVSSQALGERLSHDSALHLCRDIPVHFGKSLRVLVLAIFNFSHLVDLKLAAWAVLRPPGIAASRPNRRTRALNRLLSFCVIFLVIFLIFFLFFLYYFYHVRQGQPLGQKEVSYFPRLSRSQLLGPARHQSLEAAEGKCHPPPPAIPNWATGFRSKSTILETGSTSTLFTRRTRKSRLHPSWTSWAKSGQINIFLLVLSSFFRVKIKYSTR